MKETSFLWLGIKSWGSASLVTTGSLTVVLTDEYIQLSRGSENLQANAQNTLIK